MIVLNQIAIWNFFGVEDTTVRLDTPGLTLVVGQNGSGKTSIFIESIYFALFGQSFEYGSRPGMAVASTLLDRKGYSVTLDLTVDGTKYRIIRAKSRAKYTDGVELLCDGNPITCGTDALTQTRINTLIGMTPRAFACSVMYPVSVTKFPDMTDAEKKAVLDDILQVSLFSKAQDASKIRLSSLQQQRSQLVAQEASLTRSLVIHKGSLAEYLQRQEQFNASLLIWRQEQDARIADCQALAISIDEKRVSIEAQKLEREKAAALAQAQDDAYQVTLTGLTNARDKVTTITNHRSQIAAQLQKDKAALEGMREPENCPTCGQPWTPKHAEEEKARIRQRIEDVTSLLGKADVMLANAQKAQADAQVIVDVAKKLHQQALVSVRSFDVTIASEEGTLTGMVRNLETMKKLVQDTPPENQFTDLISGTETKIKETTDAISSLASQIEDVGRTIEDESVLVDIFGSKGAKLAVMDSVIPWLNYQADLITAEMETSLKVRFRLRDTGESREGTLDLDVINPQGSSTYRGSSAGEKRRVGFIVLMSLLRLASARSASHFDIAIFDESFENLDEIGVRGVCRVLRSMAVNKTSLFIISHSAEALSSIADNVVIVEKPGVIRSQS